MTFGDLMVMWLSYRFPSSEEVPEFEVFLDLPPGIRTFRAYRSCSPCRSVEHSSAENVCGMGAQLPAAQPLAGLVEIPISNSTLDSKYRAVVQNQPKLENYRRCEVVLARPGSIQFCNQGEPYGRFD
jgi:hypothetical protein